MIGAVPSEITSIPTGWGVRRLFLFLARSMKKRIIAATKTKPPIEAPMAIFFLGAESPLLVAIEAAAEGEMSIQSEHPW